MASRSSAASTSPRRLLLMTGDGLPDCATMRFLGTGGPRRIPCLAPVRRTGAGMDARRNIERHQRPRPPRFCELGLNVQQRPLALHQLDDDAPRVADEG